MGVHLGLQKFDFRLIGQQLIVVHLFHGCLQLIAYSQKCGIQKIHIVARGLGKPYYALFFQALHFPHKTVDGL